MFWTFIASSFLFFPFFPLCTGKIGGKGYERTRSWCYRDVGINFIEGKIRWGLMYFAIIALPSQSWSFGSLLSSAQHSSRLNLAALDQWLTDSQPIACRVACSLDGCRWWDSSMYEEKRIWTLAFENPAGVHLVSYEIDTLVECLLLIRLLHHPSKQYMVQ